MSDAISTAALIAIMRCDLRSASALAGLRKEFRRLDIDETGRLAQLPFIKALMRFGCSLLDNGDRDLFDSLLEQQPEIGENDRTVDYEDFCDALSSAM